MHAHILWPPGPLPALDTTVSLKNFWPVISFAQPLLFAGLTTELVLTFASGAGISVLADLEMCGSLQLPQPQSYTFFSHGHRRNYFHNPLMKHPHARGAPSFVGC